MKRHRRSKGLSADAVEKFEKLASITLGAAEVIEKLIELLSQHAR
jgi:hypothetical protein